MRPSMRRAKKKKVKTPGGEQKWHRVPDKSSRVCGVCGRPLLGSGSAREFSNMCADCSRKFMRAKVREYAKEG